MTESEQTPADFERASDSDDPSVVDEDSVRDHLMQFLATNPPDDWIKKGVSVEQLANLILEEDDVLREFVETNLHLYEQVKQEYPDQNIDEWWWNSVWWWPWR